MVTKNFIMTTAIALMLTGCFKNESNTTRRNHSPDSEVLVEDDDAGIQNQDNVSDGSDSLIDGLVTIVDTNNDGTPTDDSSETGDTTEGTTSTEDSTSETGSNETGGSDKLQEALESTQELVDKLIEEKAELEKQITELKNSDSFADNVKARWLDLFNYIFGIEGLNIEALIAADIAEVEAQIASVEADITAKQTQIDSLVAEIDAMKAEKATFTASFEDQLTELKEIVAPTESQIALINAIEAYLAGVAALPGLETTRTESRTALDAALVAKAELDGQKAILDSRIEAYTKWLADLNATLEVTEDAAARKPIMDDIQAYRELLEMDQKRLTDMQPQIEAAQEALDAAQETFDAAQGAVEAQIAENAGLLSEVEAAKTAELAAMDAKIAEMDTELQGYLDEKGDMNAELTKLQASLEELKGLMETYKEVASN